MGGRVMAGINGCAGLSNFMGCDAAVDFLLPLGLEMRLAGCAQIQVPSIAAGMPRSGLPGDGPRRRGSCKRTEARRRDNVRTSSDVRGRCGRFVLLPELRGMRPKRVSQRLLCWPWSSDESSQFSVYHGVTPLSLAYGRTDVDQCGTSSAAFPQKPQFPARTSTEHCGFA